MIPEYQAPLTHPETAVFIIAVPLFLTLAALLLAALFGRTVLGPVYQSMLVRYASRNRIKHVDAALIYVPIYLTEQQFMFASIVVFLTMWLGLWLITPWWLALLISPPITIFIMYIILRLAEQRYIDKLEKALPATVARMAALLGNGTGFQPVMRRMINDLPDGPLRREWLFVVERLGVPLEIGGLATPQIVVNALRFQTPSTRHRALLEHMVVALGQTHDILVKRMQAAAQALHDSDRRRSAAATELAQMRYSGMAVGLAGLFLTAYLAVTQSDRFLDAYRSPIGIFAALIVGSALMAPFVGGVWLARADDVDY